MPCLSEGVHGRRCTIQATSQGGVSSLAINRQGGANVLIFMYSHKRLTQQKKQRERERKELDALGRRHLANVRVVQRNVVYVIGIGPRFAKEEVC